MNKILKKAAAVAISAVMLCGNLPYTPGILTDLKLTTNALTFSGSCGTDLTWSFDFDSGVLLITGSGEMTSNPWQEHCNEINTIEFAPGITSIMERAFEGCVFIKDDITLPESVEYVGMEAFNFGLCNNSINVTVLNPNCELYYDVDDDGSDCESIFFNALNGYREGKITGYKNSTAELFAYYCKIPFTSLGEYHKNNDCGDDLTWSYDYMAKELTITGTGEMYNYEANNTPWNKHKSDIKTVSLPDELTSIGNNAFTSFSSLEELSIPDSVTRIGDNALSGLNIKEIILPSGLTEIGTNAFSTNPKLEAVNIPAGVAKIPSGAFALTSVKEMDIPENVSSIESGAFTLCAYLTDVYIRNPECVLPENGFVTNRLTETEVDGKKTYYTGTIHGYPGSTAETYAIANNIKFAPFTEASVKFDANGGTGTMETIKVKLNEAYALPECGFTAPENFAFASWQIGDKTYLAGAEYTVTSSVAVKALWKRTHYNISFDANGGTGTMAAVKAEAAKEFALPQCTFKAPTGKAFVGWDIGGTTYKPGDKVNVTADLALKALWLDAVKVTFAPNGGTGEMAAVTLTDFNYTLPVCSFTAPINKQFTGWFINGEVKKAGEKISLTGDLTLYAVWDAALSTVKFDANGAEGSIADVVLLKGTTFTFPACKLTAPAGKKFAGWQLGEKTYQPLDALAVNENVTIKAIWATIEYTLVYDANGGTGEMVAKTVLPGTEIVLPKCTFTAPEGAKFLGWIIGDKTYEVGDTISITENTVIKPLWSEPTAKTVLVGDVNSDGTVDSLDAMLLAHYAAAWSDIVIDLKAADLNGDNAVDNADALLLARYVAGWKGFDSYIVTKTV